MNSKELKARYPHVYESFFNSHDIVLSAPILSRYPGTGLFTSRESYFLCEKYPLRNYIGISFSSDSQDLWPSLTYKNTVSSDFIKEPLSKHYPVSRSLFRDLGFVGQINFLSEYHWPDIPSMSALIATLGLLLNTEISSSDITTLSLQGGGYGDTIKKIIQKDKQFMSQGLFNTLRNTSYFLASSALSSSCHFLNINGERFVPVSDTKKYVHADISSFILNPNIFLKPFFQSRSIIDHENEIRDIASKTNLSAGPIGYLEGSELLSNQMTIELFGRLQNSYSNEEMNDGLLETIRLSAAFRFGIFKDALDRQLPINQLWEVIKRFVGDNVIGCAVQAGRRVQIFGNRELDISEAILQALREELHFPFTLDYSSHTDGWESRGLIVERFYDQGIASEFCFQQQFITLYNNLITKKGVDDVKGDMIPKDGIFIDTKRGQIFYKGERVNSNELKSQGMTCELLHKICFKSDKCVTNQDLRNSSYTKNINEMNGKIILPLKQSFQSHFGIELRLKAHSLGAQKFDINIDMPKDIPFYFLV